MKEQKNKSPLDTKENKGELEGLRGYLKSIFEGRTMTDSAIKNFVGENDSSKSKKGGLVFSRDLSGLEKRAATIQTSTLTGAMVNALPEQSLFANEIFYKRIRCQILENILFNYRMVDETVTPAAEWIAESGVVSNSEPEYDDYNEVTPHDLVVSNTYSRRVAKSVPSSVVDLFIRRLIYGRDKLIDSTLLYGDGTGANPLGIYEHPDVNIASGASLNKATLDAIEKRVDTAEAPWEGRFYLIHPNLAETLKSRAADGGNTKFLLYVHPNGMLYLNNYPVIISPRVTATHLFFGHFSSVLISFFGELEIFTKMLVRTGDVVVTLVDTADITLIRPDWIEVLDSIT